MESENDEPIIYKIGIKTISPTDHLPGVDPGTILHDRSDIVTSDPSIKLDIDRYRTIEIYGAAQ